MRILAIDLGKSKSVACEYDARTAKHSFFGIRTVPSELQDLLEKVRPERVVIEICNQAGWVGDQIRAAGIALQVANPNGAAWQWRRVKRKTDRDDALKLARLAALNQVPEVYLPERVTRQWRSLIQYRQALVSRRTAVKNRIRSILDREALTMPAGKSGWSMRRLQVLQEWARPVEDCVLDDFWRGQLFEELAHLGRLEASIKRVEAGLDKLASADARVGRLMKVPGVGKRLAEMLVAVIDDPHRFTNGKQVAAYAGLTPRQFQSGTMDRQGRITGRGNKDLRKLLVEVSWIGLRCNPRMRSVYERISQGSRTRKKLAIVAVARRLLIWCWAILRDGTDWQADRPAAAEPLRSEAA